MIYKCSCSYVLTCLYKRYKFIKKVICAKMKKIQVANYLFLILLIYVTKNDRLVMFSCLFGVRNIFGIRT